MGSRVHSERTYDDDGNPQFFVYIDDEMGTFLTLTFFEGQWYPSLDYGSAGVDAEPAKTPLQAYFNVRKQAEEAEKWATEMLAAEEAGRVEWHHESVERPDGIVEMKGSWKIKPIN